MPEAGELLAWSRILDDEEALCVVNVNGEALRGADVLVDAALNSAVGATLTVVINTESIDRDATDVSHGAGSQLPIRRRADGAAFVEIRNLAPSEVLVLTNRP